MIEPGPEPKKIKISSDTDKIDSNFNNSSKENIQNPGAAADPTVERTNSESVQSNFNIKNEAALIMCKHFVKRKKRFCKMTVAKGKQYCGEHEPIKPDDVQTNRIPCPLDEKHTIYAKNLKKHLKICNARLRNDLPTYIQAEINSGSDCEDPIDISEIKLNEIPETTLSELCEKIEKLYYQYVDGKIEESILETEIIKPELLKQDYGQEKIKHLVQTASILGNLQHLNFLKDHTDFIEFGAGKGQVSFWLAQIISENNFKSNIILLDRASLRHKKDNKLEDRSMIHRIRADISDFDMNNSDLLTKCKNDIVAVSKHLCGAATDLTLRCLLNESSKKDSVTSRCEGFLIALCCHHRCEWKSFVGKQFFQNHGFSKRDFIIITKMVGWAICGTGMSRERRKELQDRGIDVNLLELNNENKLNRIKKQEYGRMCKRIIDYSRLLFLNENGYDCHLNYYVNKNVTLENVCFIGKRKKSET